MAEPSDGVPLGVPMSNHEYDLTDAESLNKNGFPTWILTLSGFLLNVSCNIK